MTFFLPAFIGLACLGAKCEHDDPSDPMPKRHIQNVASLKKEIANPSLADPTVNYDSLFKELRPIQDSIYKNREGLKTIGHLLNVSFDTVSGCFFLIGKGVTNPEHPENIRLKARLLAAAYDGKRWALYCKAWRQGSKIGFGRKIGGDILYSKTVWQHLEGDTLYALIEVPIGSIVIK
ncbi:MAG: hypothetical protein PHC61_18615 [Chitinivibrionales bacterium]|nr:hypothetical protein [Chitinivibrionales bacterium]